MWKEKHFRALPKIRIDKNSTEVINIGDHRRGIVEELEKAHIYIKKLNNTIKNLEERVNQLETQIENKQYDYLSL